MSANWGCVWVLLNESIVILLNKKERKKAKSEKRHKPDSLCLCKQKMKRKKRGGDKGRWNKQNCMSRPNSSSNSSRLPRMSPAPTFTALISCCCCCCCCCRCCHLNTPANIALNTLYDTFLLLHLLLDLLSIEHIYGVISLPYKQQPPPTILTQVHTSVQWTQTSDLKQTHTFAGWLLTF